MNGFCPFNPKLGQRMQTNVDGIHVDASYIAHFQVSADDAVATDVDGVHVAIIASVDTTKVIVDEITNPAVPRNITATVACDTVANIKAVKVKITGTNYAGEIITEELPAFTEDTAGTVEGNKAFKTITKIEVPAMDGADVSVTIGWGDKLGLPYKLAHNTCLMAFLDNTIEATAPVIAVSASKIEDNTVDLNSNLNGKVVDVYLIV